MKSYFVAFTMIVLVGQSVAEADRPNIIVIMVDDMGFSDIGPYGSEIPTPHLDALATGGVRFSQFYNTGRCCPTRASLLTGLYSHQSGIGWMTTDQGEPGYAGRLNDQCVTIAEVLGSAGYFTAMTGKWHVGFNHGVTPWGRGFHRSLNLPAGGLHFSNQTGSKGGTELAFRREIYAAQIVRMDHNIGRIVSKLRELGKLENTLLMFLSDNGCCAEGGMFGYPWKKNTEANFAQWRRQSGRSSSTGEAWSNASNTPFRMHKRWVHEGGIATPLIVHWPDVVTAGGRLSHQPGHVVDVMSTCLQVAGVEYSSVDAGLDVKPTPGKSLLPAIRDPSVRSERTLYWEHETHAAIRKGDWKLVTTKATDTNAWELYNFSDVRTETGNLADQHPDRVEQLRFEWIAWAKQANVLPWPKDRMPRPMNGQKNVGTKE